MKIMEHYHGKITSGLSKTESPSLIGGLNPYQILEKVTSHSKNERYTVCWKEKSKMTGQKFSGRFIKQNLCSSELRQQSGYIDVFSYKSRERLRTISVPYWVYHEVLDRAKAVRQRNLKHC